MDFPSRISKAWLSEMSESDEETRMLVGEELARRKWSQAELEERGISNITIPASAPPSQPAPEQEREETAPDVHNPFDAALTQQPDASDVQRAVEAQVRALTGDRRAKGCPGCGRDVLLTERGFCAECLQFVPQKGT